MLRNVNFSLKSSVFKRIFSQFFAVLKTFWRISALVIACLFWSQIHKVQFILWSYLILHTNYFTFVFSSNRFHTGNKKRLINKSWLCSSVIRTEDNALGPFPSSRFICQWVVNGVNLCKFQRPKSGFYIFQCFFCVHFWKCFFSIESVKSIRHWNPWKIHVKEFIHSSVSSFGIFQEFP